MKTARSLGTYAGPADPLWRTPAGVFTDLDREFDFTLDPCAAGPIKRGIQWFGARDDGLAHPWHGRVFVNPPYGRAIADWMAKIVAERVNCEVIVALVPARSDTAWWHDCALLADQVRFVRGRLSFEGVATAGGRRLRAGASPFPSVLLVYRPAMHPDANVPSRNHYDWFIPENPAAGVDAYLDDFETKMTEGLTDPFVHDMAQAVLPLIAVYRGLRAAHAQATPPARHHLDRIPLLSDLGDTLCYLRRHPHLATINWCRPSRNEAGRIILALQARQDHRAELES